VFGIHHCDSQLFSPIAFKLGKTMTDSYFKPQNGNRTMCSGSVMGYNFALIEVYSKIQKYLIDNNETDCELGINNIDISDINYKMDVDGIIFWLWEPESLYEFMEIILNKYYPHYDQSFDYKNGKVTFKKNNKTPEFIHGVGHRDMSAIIDKKYNFTHKTRKFVQEDLNLIVNNFKYIFLIVVFLFIMLLYYFYNKHSSK
jgi:hypothetical protein